MEPDYFDGIPDEVYLQVMLHANYGDLLSLCNGNRRSYRLCADESFWRDKLLRDYGLKSSLRAKDLYHRLYNEGIRPGDSFKILPVYKVNTIRDRNRQYLGTIIIQRGDNFDDLSDKINSLISDPLTRLKIIPADKYCIPLDLDRAWSDLNCLLVIYNRRIYNPGHQ